MEEFRQRVQRTVREETDEFLGHGAFLRPRYVHRIDISPCIGLPMHALS